MGYKIEEIEGIGPTFGEKLSKAEIRSTDDLLKHCGDRGGRKRVADASGLSEKQLLKWANMADLMRVKGVGPEYAELLEGAGVDTIKELRTRRSDNLATKMSEVNATKKLTRKVPTEDMVGEWIDQAKGLTPTITH